MANLELYELEGCPYCAKVTKKLDELGLDYESHMVPRDEDNGVDGMPESDDIVEYLEKTYGQ